MSASVASDAYAGWIEERIAQGFEPWFVAYMFDQLPGTSAARAQRMFQIVEQIYRMRMTRLFRHPRAASNHHRRPILLAALDLPIFKHTKQNLRDVVINDGLHVQGVVLESGERRPGCKPFAEFCWDERDLIRRYCPELQRIDVRAITHNVPDVTSYMLKQIEQRVSADDMLLLPRTNQELRSTGHVGRQSSIFAPEIANPVVRLGSLAGRGLSRLAAPRR